MTASSTSDLVELERIAEASKIRSSKEKKAKIDNPNLINRSSRFGDNVDAFVGFDSDAHKHGSIIPRTLEGDPEETNNLAAIEVPPSNCIILENTTSSRSEPLTSILSRTKNMPVVSMRKDKKRGMCTFFRAANKIEVHEFVQQTLVPSTRLVAQIRPRSLRVGALGETSRTNKNKYEC